MPWSDGPQLVQVSPTEGRRGCSQALATTGEAAVSTLRGALRACARSAPSGEQLGAQEPCPVRSAFPWALGSWRSASSPARGVPLSWISGILTGVQRYLVVASVCISLVTRDLELLFMCCFTCRLCRDVSPFVKFLLTSSAHFLIGSFVSFLKKLFLIVV